MFRLYTDGSCSGNGAKENFGGYGVVVTFNDKIVKLYKQGKQNTTNNEMELQAIYEAIKIAKILSQNKNEEIVIYSDSAYCVNTINNWMYTWASNGWIKKTDKKPPENLILIKNIYELMQFERKIKVEKIKGHNGDVFNEKADELATSATFEIQQKYLKK
jgi:ribonuclease HI